MTNLAINSLPAIYDFNIPIARYRFTAKANQKFISPEYIGSLLRGQLGEVLRTLSCITQQEKCNGCFMRKHCAYSNIFENILEDQNSVVFKNQIEIPNPYIIEPPVQDKQLLEILPGQNLSFHLVLVGKALSHLPLIVLAFQRALKRGLGFNNIRTSFELTTVELCSQLSVFTKQYHTIWSINNPTLLDHQQSFLIPKQEKNIKQINLQFVSPLRLQKNGQPIKVDDLNIQSLLSTLARRCTLILEYHAGISGLNEQAKQLHFYADFISDKINMEWLDWTRFSSRQQQTMKLGGALGSWEIVAKPEILNALWPWLYLGEILHIGKNAVMGLGQYQLEPLYL